MTTEDFLAVYVPVLVAIVTADFIAIGVRLLWNRIWDQGADWIEEELEPDTRDGAEDDLR